MQCSASADEPRPLHERVLTTSTVRDALTELLGYEILLTDPQGRAMRLDGTFIDKTKLHFVQGPHLVLYNPKARSNSRLLQFYGTRERQHAALLDALRLNPK